MKSTRQAAGRGGCRRKLLGLSALEEYARLTLEYQTTKEAYDIEPSKENWDNLQGAVRRLKRQDEIIKLNRGLFETEKKQV